MKSDSPRGSSTDEAAVNDILVSAANLVAVTHAQYPEKLIESCLVYEVAGKSIRVAIENKREPVPGELDQLAQLSALVHRDLTSISRELEQKRAASGARQAALNVEGEQALREVFCDSVGASDRDPDAWATGFSDARQVAIDSLCFRFDIPRLHSWDQLVAELARRIPVTP